MKRLLACISLFAVGAAPAFAVAEGLVAYWTFDEGSGDETQDLTGNGHDGELQNGVEWTEGAFHSALAFDDPAEYVLVPDRDDLDLADAVTYSLHFKPMGDLTSRRLMVKNDAVFVIFDFGNPLSIDFLVKPNNDFAESTTTDWEEGRWYHFAGTFDGSELRVYVDGVLEGETPNNVPIPPSDLDLWIGADDFGRPTDAFPGAVDDVRIYNRALDESEVREAMSGPLSVHPRGKAASVWAALKR